MTTAEINHYIALFVKGGGRDEGRVPTGRYASFDYCFNYFQFFRETGRVKDLVSPANMQVSCLQLGFYLASWGMLRGSSFLLQKSAKHFEPVITLISKSDARLWAIDADRYDKENIACLLTFARALREALGGSATDTLVTKIMLGVFGNVPAFDSYFRKGMNMPTFGPRTLSRVADFYTEHRVTIDHYQRCLSTFDFTTGQNTKRHYTKAKVIDMIGFIAGE